MTSRRSVYTRTTTGLPSADAVNTAELANVVVQTMQQVLEQPPFSYGGETFTIADGGVLNQMLENDWVVINSQTCTLGDTVSLTTAPSWEVANRAGIGTSPDATYRLLIQDTSSYLKLTDGTRVSTLAQASDALTLTAGQSLVVQPAADSTTAVTLANAASTAIVSVDSTNKRVGVNSSTPAVPLHIKSNDVQDPLVRMERLGQYWEWGVEADNDMVLRPSTGSYYNIQHSDSSYVMRVQGGQHGVSVGFASDPTRAGLDVLGNGSTNAYDSGTSSVTIANLASCVCSATSSTGYGNGIGFAQSSQPNGIGAAIIGVREGSWSKTGLLFATKSTTTQDSTIPVRMVLSSGGQLTLGNAASSITDCDAILDTQGALALKEIASGPSTASGYAKLYAKTDEVLYYLDGSGTEHSLAGSILEIYGSLSRLSIASTFTVAITTAGSSVLVNSFNTEDQSTNASGNEYTPGLYDSLVIGAGVPATSCIVRWSASATAAAGSFLARMFVQRTGSATTTPNASQCFATLTAGAYSAMSGECILELEDGDTLKLYAINESGTADIELKQLSLSVWHI